MRLRQFAVALMAFAGISATGLQTAHAEYPDKPVRIFVGYAPGGPTDTYARLLAKTLQEQNKQTFLVENRPGAGGKLAPQAMLQLPSDGYNLLFAGQPLLTSVFHKAPGFDAMKDLQIVGSIYTTPFFLAVNASLPVKTLKELQAYTQANPGKVNLAAGTVTGEMMGAVLTKSGGFDMTPIRYKGNAPALQALLAGEVHVHFDQYAPLKAQADAGKIRIIASTGDKRTSLAPLVPTFAEGGVPQLTILSTATILARSDLPQPIVRKLHAMIQNAVKTPALGQRFKTDAVDPHVASLEETRATVQREFKFWSGAAQAANYVPE